MHTSRTGRSVVFGVLPPFVSPCTFLRSCVGGGGGASGSLLTVAAILVYIQAGRESGRADLILVCFHHYKSPCTFLPG